MMYDPLSPEDAALRNRRKKKKRQRNTCGLKVRNNRRFIGFILKSPVKDDIRFGALPAVHDTLYNHSHDQK